MTCEKCLRETPAVDSKGLCLDCHVPEVIKKKKKPETRKESRRKKAPTPRWKIVKREKVRENKIRRGK